MRETNSFPCCTVLVAKRGAAIALVALESPEQAGEGGVSFWAPGQFGSSAPRRGARGAVYLHSSVDAGESRSFLIAGRLAAGGEAGADLAFFFPTFTFSESVLGAQAALCLGFAVGHMRARAKVAVTGNSTQASPRRVERLAFALASAFARQRAGGGCAHGILTMVGPGEIFTIFFVTPGPLVAIRQLMEQYELARNRAASEVQASLHRPGLRADAGAAKPQNIGLHIGRRPALAFGNSDGDLAMLRYAKSRLGASLALLLHHDDDEREVAYDRDFKLSPLVEALDQRDRYGITLVSMKRDWKTVFVADNA